MRVAPQVKAEMAVILGGVFGLGLAAQYHFVHQRFGIVSVTCASTRLNNAGRNAPGFFRERQIERLQEFLQVMNFLE